MIRKTRGDISQLIPDEAYVRVMLNALQGHYLLPMVYVTLYYGLRKSEVLGLRWQDIDFEKNTITIQHTIVKNKTIVEKDSTKTENSHAVMFLMEDVKNVIKEEVAECEKRHITDWSTIKST